MEEVIMYKCRDCLTDEDPVDLLRKKNGVLGHAEDTGHCNFEKVTLVTVRISL